MSSLTKEGRAVARTLEGDASMAAGADLLRIEDLSITFALLGGRIQAVRRSNLRVLPGKVTALVGESGSGKSVISQAVMGILPRTATVSGRILFSDPKKNWETTDILTLSRDGPEIRELRGSRMGKIFQEPMTSLSPLHTIGNQIGEVLKIHTPLDKAEIRERTIDMLGLVGFSNPARAYDMYPFELSGGMRQRAMIAMALICRPALLIADEPTTALDVTIQAQILELLADLRRSEGLAILLISHDLGVVGELCDRVAVMYSGRIVERGPAALLLERPRHPYTRGLLRSRPRLDAPRAPDGRLPAIRGQVPDPRDRPSGCAFHPRCPIVQPDCRAAVPPLLPIAPGHDVACPWSDRGRMPGQDG